MSAIDKVLKSKEFRQTASELAQVGRFFAERGWSPATSSNYSARLHDEHGSSQIVAISRSGVDKYLMADDDFLAIGLSENTQDASYSVVAAPVSANGAQAQPSAETLIHTSIYHARKSAQAVLHTHSPNNTRLSLRFLEQNHLAFKGYELQKGFEGQIHHENVVRVPILANSQDMKMFSTKVLDLLAREREIWGFLIAGHGLYTWGSSLAAAKRHVETFEFLFSCHVLELMGV